MTSLEIAILKTLAYADIFDHALSTDELHRYLIGYKLNRSDQLARQQAPSFKHHDDTWVLQPHEGLLQLKKAHALHTNHKIRQAKKYQRLFGLLPWIQFVGITGSVAGGTPKPDDDIDLIIIATKNRLWLTRLILTIMLNSIGKRRKPADDQNRVNNKFCLNMWLSEDNLIECNQDLYTANELAHIIPLLNRHHTYERYIHANSWLRTVLPNFFESIGASQKSNGTPHSNFHILNSLDQLAERFQRKVMKTPTVEMVESSRLAFHPRDYRSSILQRYQQRLQKLGLS